MIRSLLVLLLASAAHAAPPELIVVGDNITTADPTRPAAQAFAVTDGRFSYVGTRGGALAMKGPQTRVMDVGARRVLPGLVDAHVHPLGIIDLDVCDLRNEAKPLSVIAQNVHDCVIRYKLKPGEWLKVAMWNFSNGNQPDAAHPTLRAALDAGAPGNPVQLEGWDGHHGAYNSMALRRASTDTGAQIGLSRATLAGPFAAYRELVGVDASGQPSGGVNENARKLMGGDLVDASNLKAILQAPEKLTQRLNDAGITAFLDAQADPDNFIVYDTLEQRGHLTAHTSLAQFFDPDVVVRADGSPDYDRMVAGAILRRKHYAHDSLIRADIVKLYADGVLEGNPLAEPPTLPNSPSVKPYLQPVFGRDTAGRATFAGRYAGKDDPACGVLYRTEPDHKLWRAQHGFDRAQCSTGSGKPQHPRAVMIEWVRRMHAAGFGIHIHAIGDGAVHVAIDALETARADDPPGSQRRPDTLAHVQLVTPDDVVRIGRDHLFLAMTYAWIYTDKEYDLSVIPFVQHVTGDSYAALHQPGAYYERQAYPAGAMRRAGGVLVAGSDAPVETRDPRPFINMQSAVTRARDGTPALGAIDQRITIAEAVQAYTLDGARSLGREDEFGSISVGKSADWIVLDRDVMRVPADRIGATRVQQTWFQGKQVAGR